MAIKGRNEIGRVPILGHIKIGGRKKIQTKSGDEKVIPVKYDHFVLTTNEQDELGYIQDDVLMQKLLADQLNILVSEHTERIYNDAGQFLKTVQTVPTDELQKRNTKLTRIVVILPFDNIDDNIVTCLAIYDKDGCRCRGDGEFAEYVDPRTGEATKVKCPCKMLVSKLNIEDDVDARPDHERVQNGMRPDPSRGMVCKANGNLRIMIHRARTLGGIHIFRTTSLNSIGQLEYAMKQIHTLTGGILAGIPMVLELQPKRVVPAPNKKPQLAYVVTLTYRASINEFLREIVDQTAMRESLRKQIASKEILALPPPGQENKYEQIAIREEFYAASVIDGDCEVLVDAESIDQPVPAVQEPEKAPEPKARAKAKPKPEPEKLSPQASAPPAAPEKLAEPAAVTEKPPEEKPPQEAAAPQEPPKTEPEAPAKAEEPVPTPQEQAAPAPSPSSLIAHGRFPAIDTNPPDGADTSPASIEIRKAFFENTRKAGYTDEEIRELLEKLWRIQSSSRLKTWQVTAMTKAING